MTDLLIIGPLLVVLTTCVCTLLSRGWPRIQRLADVLGTVTYAGVVGVLAYNVVFAPAGGPLTTQIGGWRAPFGITLVADELSVFMLVLTAIVFLFASVFSVYFIDEENQRVYYHPLFQFLLLGTTGAFLTGDLFNLFVWFEVMLMASYVFVAFYGNDQHTAAAMRYVVLNILGGALMLLAVGGLYATIGTLNMADMALQLSDGGVSATPVVGFGTLLLVTFALKAGLVPFQFWVPGAYRAAPLPVVALFAGVTKKVGIYAIVRVYFTAFGEVSLTGVRVSGLDSMLGFLAPALLLMGIASILVGGIGAVSHDNLEGLLAFSSIGQVGFIVVPIAIAAAATPDSTLEQLGIVAALVYTLHHALTKGLLFLAVGVIRDAVGTTELTRLGGLASQSSVFASVFFVGGLSLVGIPPLTGFFGKLFVFDTAIREFAAGGTGTPGARAGAAVVVVVLFAGALLTILYATRSWVGSFWGEPTDLVAAGEPDTIQVTILAVMAALVVIVGVGFEPVYQFADAAAEAATDTDGYVELVDPERGGEN